MAPAFAADAPGFKALNNAMRQAAPTPTAGAAPVSTGPVVGTPPVTTTRAAQTSAIAAVQTSINSMTTAATATATLNSAYAAYQWAQPYIESSPGNGNWAQIAMSNGDAEAIVGVAATRCGSDSTSTVASTVSRLNSVVGASAGSSYSQARGVMCSALQAAAQMLYRYQKYQDYKTNGYTIKSASVSRGFDFPGNHHRTGQMGMSFMWYPDLQDTATNGFSMEDRLQYNSWFKWSDNATSNLNIIKKLRESTGSDEAMLCIPLVDGGGASASICVNNLTANVSSSTSSISVTVWAKFRAYSRDKTLDLGTITLPAPFGYLDEIAQMKDNAKQNVMNQIKAQVVALTGLDQQTVALLQTAYTLSQQVAMN
jgi:hypothetical protein